MAGYWGLIQPLHPSTVLGLVAGDSSAVQQRALLWQRSTSSVVDSASCQETAIMVQMDSERAPIHPQES